jgi:hypothetical protein
VVNGIILPSVVTKDLFERLTLEYIQQDILVLIGEKGVGKKAFSRALHTRFHGSDRSFLQTSEESLRVWGREPRGRDGILTACISISYETVADFEANPDWNRVFRKVIVIVDIPSFDRSTELRIERAMSEKHRSFTVPPLRFRKSEAVPLLCYWHQKLSPEKTLDRHIAEKSIAGLAESGFEGNVTSIVDLARELAG